MGGMAATVLGTMDIPRPKVAAIIFVIAGLSAAAPPVNLWAMLTAAGVNMPYVGFFLPLLVPCVLLALATIFILGRKAKPVDLDQGAGGAPRGPGPDELAPGRGCLSSSSSLLVVAGRVFPFDVPVLGLPLMFAAAAATALLLSPVKIAFLRISRGHGPPAPAAHRDADLRRDPGPDHDPDRRPRPHRHHRRSPCPSRSSS